MRLFSNNDQYKLFIYYASNSVKYILDSHFLNLYHALTTCFLYLSNTLIHSNKLPIKCLSDDVSSSSSNTGQLSFNNVLGRNLANSRTNSDSDQDVDDDYNDFNNIDRENIDLQGVIIPGCLNILGLNICGIASKLRNGAFEHYAKHFDVICLTETRTNSPDLSNTSLNSFKCFSLMPKRESYRYGGIHGICVLVREKYSKHCKVIENLSSLSTLWLFFPKDVFKVSFVLGITYLPGEISKHHDKEMYSNMLEDILKLKERYDVPICIVGDLNSRTGTLDDFVTIDDHVARSMNLDNVETEIFSSKSDLMNKGFDTNRYSKDITSNDNGHQLIEVCRAADIKIVNGRFGSDHKIGNFTCHKPNGSSVVDYFIVSPDLFDSVLNFNVGQMDILFSDVHSPITLSLNILKKSVSIPPNNPNHENIDSLPSDIPFNHIKTKWLPERKNEYLSSFDLDLVNKLYSDLQIITGNNCDGTSQLILDEMIGNLGNILLGPSIRCGFSKKVTPNVNESKRVKNTNKPWFDTNCKSKRNEYFRIKNRLKKCTINDRLKVE